MVPRLPLVGRSEQVAIAEATDLDLTVPGELPARRVHGDEPAVDVCREDAIVDALHHRREEPLASAHLLLCHPQGLLHLLERGHELLGILLRDREVVLDDHPGRRGAQRGGEQPLEADPEGEQLGDGEVGGALLPNSSRTMASASSSPT